MLSSLSNQIYTLNGQRKRMKNVLGETVDGVDRNSVNSVNDWSFIFQALFGKIIRIQFPRVENSTIKNTRVILARYFCWFSKRNVYS